MELPDYGKPYWDPFWELCNDLRVPLNFHIGGDGRSDAESRRLIAWPSFGPEHQLALHGTMFLMSNASTIGNFIYSGLFDRYPNLKLVSVESGIGWIPFVLEALEYQYDEMVPAELKNLQRRPKEYFRDHWYACFWFEDFGPRALTEQIGPNNILFETDFPHPTCLYPKAQQHIADVLQDLKPEVRRRVLQDNAAELYGLTVPDGAA
jgi:predicted TIM-barrel fold metal-dependent hydrolase